MGTPFKRLEKLNGHLDRVLDRASKHLHDEEAAGRSPFCNKLLPDNVRTNDPLLDRIIRTIISRRARMR